MYVDAYTKGRKEEPLPSFVIGTHVTTGHKQHIYGRVERGEEKRSSSESWHRERRRRRRRRLSEGLEREGCDARENEGSQRGGREGWKRVSQTRSLLLPGGGCCCCCSAAAAAIAATATATAGAGGAGGVQGGPRGCKDGGQGGGEREKGRASVMIRRCFNDSAFLWQRACRGRPPRRPASVSTRVEGALSGQPPY